MIAIDRKTMRLITATSVLGCALYWAPTFVGQADGGVAFAQDATSNSRPIEIINSPGARVAQPAAPVTGIVEVIESPNAAKPQRSDANRLSNNPTVASPSAPEQLAPAVSASATLAQPESLTPPVPASAPTPAPQSDTASPMQAAAADSATAFRATGATDSSAPAEPPVPKKRSAFDPRNLTPPPKATAPRALPTLSQIEGPKAPNTSTPSTGKSTKSSVSAPATTASVEPAPRPVRPRPQASAPAQTTLAASPPPPIQNRPSVALHSYPSTATQSDASISAAQNAEPAQKPAEVAPPAQTTPLVQPPTAPVATESDSDLGVMAAIRPYIPHWLGHLPPDLAFFGVIALCIVLGLITAGIRRSRETYD